MTSQLTAIPEQAGLVEAWHLIPLEECGEPMVAIGPGTDYDEIVTSAVYAGEHLHSPYRDDNVIDAASTTIFVRKSVADRLKRAQAMLPSGMKLIVFDGYRSVEVQSALFDQFLRELEYIKPDWSEAQRIEETQRYIALPSTDCARPSPHATGGAVDVAIIQDGHMIEFGTPFDHGSPRSALRYFEDDSNVRHHADVQARTHRRLLYGVMYEVGFEGYEHEWWHFNAIETQMGACAAGRREAIYGIATTLLPTSSSLAPNRVSSTHDEPSAPIDRIAPTN